jgi:Uma2 family endonuclease
LTRSKRTPGTGFGWPRLQFACGVVHSNRGRSRSRKIADLRRLLGDRLAVPDLSGWRVREEEPIPPGFVFANPMTQRPDWCCEVLSPSTEKIDRELKLPLHAEAGVAWIWLVDPERRRVEIFQAVERKAALLDVVEGDAERAVPPFNTVVDMSRWWVTQPPE